MAGGTAEPDANRVDTEFGMLLDGLRTTLPGVQVLFAFLLTIPFQQRFADLDDVEKTAYLVALLSAAASSVLLIAPSVHQRVRAPVDGVERRHEAHLRSAIRLTIAGSVFMAIALLAALVLVTEIVVDVGWATAITVAMGVLLLWSWFYLPVVSYRESDDPSTDDTARRRAERG